MSIQTINYYNNNANEYIESTTNVNMSSQYELFLKHINGKDILDVGFGSGRDSKYFLENGYTVTAIDPCAAFCDHAREIGIVNVHQISVQDIEFEKQFDGIWACASLLHVPHNELIYVFRKLKNALKPKGILYASFKYGVFEGEKNGRYFTNLTKEALEEVLEVANFRIIEFSISDDQLANREEKWLNVIAR